jgi:hypothetical protein
MDSKFSAVAHALGAKDAAPKKEIREISVRKSHNGGHIIKHKHHHPDHHPDEEHTTHGDKAMAAHMLANAGTPSPDAAADPAAAGAPPMTAAPTGAAPAPTAQA